MHGCVYACPCSSIGYRSEDGRKLSPASGSSSLVSRGGGSPVGEAFGASYGCGDMIGCGVHHLSRSLFFTKNGVFVGVAGKLDPQVEYYPSVGMHATDEKVKFNFTGPFAFDLQKMLQVCMYTPLYQFMYLRAHVCPPICSLFLSVCYRV